MSKHSSAGGGQKTEVQQIGSKDAEKAELNSVPQIRLAWSPENEEDGAPLHRSKSCIGVGWLFWILFVTIVAAIIAAIVICTGTDACKSCKPVDGVWTDSGWSLCSANCGGGTQKKLGSCTRPNECGTECSGYDESRECNTEPCQAPCDKPDINDGKVEPDSATINSGTNYGITCNDGFVISGVSSITCTNGVLSTVPTCQPASCNKPYINDGKVEPDRLAINSGTNYEIICNDGFVISGITPVTCTNGVLSTVPTCQPAPCDKPDINDGKVEPDSATINSGTNYEVTCNDGFVISGITPVTCTNGVLSTVPTCQPAPCDKPDINDGKVEPDSATINSGTNYEIICNDGFVISGITPVTCTNGVLSTVPTCQPAPCDKPDINDGNVEPDSATINSGTTYEVTCNDDFELSGLSTVTCSNGELSALPTCDPTCPDCSFAQSEWKANIDSASATYRATKDKCGEFFVNLADNTLTITTTDNSGVDTYPVDPEDSISLNVNLNLDWKLAKTVKNNETMRFVFSDQGNKYAGFSNIDGNFFETKPTGESKQQFTLWTSEDNPSYLPIYLSRDDTDKSLCMFADAQGAPMEITLTERETEWLIYRFGEVKFFIYHGDSVDVALNQCMEKWKEIYPASDASWTNDFIVGSLTTDKIKTDQDSGNSIATHYLLSPDVISMKKDDLGYELLIENQDDLADSTNIILPLKTRQTITSGSGITLTPEKGYYPTDGDDTYILDFDNSQIQSDLDSYLSDTDAGFLLQGGFRLNPTSEDCSKYFHCPDQQFEDDTSVCLSADFGDSKVFQKHNFYDVSKRKALQPQNVAKNLVLETIASPGTTHYHRSDLDLTDAGLKTCYHNIVNLQKLGIRAVTCNMCGGVAPSSPDQESICFRWGLLSLLMPYVIISSEVEDLTGALSSSGGDVFMKMKESIVLRKQLHYYLDKTYETSKPFITEKSNGVVIGDNLFMVVNLEGSPKVTVELPEGEWLAPGSSLQTEGTYFNVENDSPELTFEEDVTKLVFYKLNNIFVLQDKDDENKVEVHIFQYNEGYYGSDITSTFTYNEHKTDITLDLTNEQVTFTYTAASSTIDKDKFKVSKLVIFYWDKDAGNALPKSTHPVGDKFNVVFNYSEGNNVELKSIFEDWNENLEKGNNS